MNGENQSMFTPMTLDKTIEQYNSTKQRLNTERGQQMTSQRFANMENNLSLSINSDDEDIKKQGNLASRTGLVAQMISEEASKHGKDFSTMTDGEILDTYKKKNPKRAGIIDGFINSDQDPYELKKAMGWSNTPVVEVNKEPEKTFADKAKTSAVGPLARAVGALFEGVYGIGEGVANIPDRAREFNEWENERGYYNEDGTKADTSLYDKIKWFAKLAGTLGQMGGDVIGGGLVGAADGFTTNQEQAAIKDGVTDVVASLINSEPAQKVQELYNSLDDSQKQEVKDWASVIDGISNFSFSALGGKGVKEAVKQGAKAFETQAIKQGVKQLDNITDTVKKGVKNYQINNAIENRAKNTAKAESTAGRIVQSDGKTIKEIEQANKEAANAFNIADVKGVKTYKELGGKLSTKKEDIAKKVDDILSKDTNKYSGSATKTVEIADGVSEAIEYTPAQDALDDLTALYTKIGDKEGLAKVGYIESKLGAEGLTLKELNDLAKMHGNEFRRKAFKEDGTPKFSDIGDKFEINRKNLKEYVRDLLPDDTTKNLDMAYHNLSDTEYLVNKMAAKVENLSNKIKEKNLFEKIGGGTAVLLNTLSGGSLKAFLTKLLPSNMGNKINNALDMEKELPKLLSTIDDLNRKIDLARTDKEKEEIAKIIENAFNKE